MTAIVVRVPGAVSCTVCSPDETAAYVVAAPKSSCRARTPDLRLTVTWCSLIDACTIRTSAFPVGGDIWSFSTSTRSPGSGPRAATV